MKYLIIDTSGTNLTIILFDNNNITIKYCYEIHKHLLNINNYIQQILNCSKTTIDDLDFIVCIVGPGSFTGLRIGVITTKTLCYVYKKPILSITLFDILAKTINKDSYHNYNIVLCIREKNDYYYACEYDLLNCKIINKPVYSKLSEINKLYLNINNKVVVDNVRILDNLNIIINYININYNKLLTNNIDIVSPLYIATVIKNI